MINTSVEEIIEKLIKKTKAGQVIWTKTSRDTEFKLELAKGAITTDNWHDDETGLDFIDFAIYNIDGNAIERVVFDISNVEDYMKIFEVYELAKNGYYRIDETFKNIFNELDGDKVIGRDPKADLPF